MNGNLKIDIDKEFFTEEKEVYYFYSSELTKIQLDSLITEGIKTSEIFSRSIKHSANLTEHQTRKFNDVLNCNYINNIKQLNSLRK